MSEHERSTIKRRLHCVRSRRKTVRRFIAWTGAHDSLWYSPRLAAQFIRGGGDQILPIGAAALNSAKLVKNATLKIYPGVPHGLTNTHKYQLNADLLAFLNT